MIRAELIHHDGSTELVGLFATLDDVAAALGLSDWSEQAAMSGYSRGDVLAAWAESGVFRQDPFGNDLGLLLVPGGRVHEDAAPVADSPRILENEGSAAPARWRRLFAAENSCEHLNVWALSDGLSVLDNEDEAAAAAAGLYQCDDCGAVVVPAERPRGFMWRGYCAS